MERKCTLNQIQISFILCHCWLGIIQPVKTVSPGEYVGNTLEYVMRKYDVIHKTAST